MAWWVMCSLLAGMGLELWIYTHIKTGQGWRHSFLASRKWRQGISRAADEPYLGLGERGRGQLRETPDLKPCLHMYTYPCACALSHTHDPTHL